MAFRDAVEPSSQPNTSSTDPKPARARKAHRKNWPVGPPPRKRGGEQARKLVAMASAAAATRHRTPPRRLSRRGPDQPATMTAPITAPVGSPARGRSNGTQSVLLARLPSARRTMAAADSGEPRIGCTPLKKRPAWDDKQEGPPRVAASRPLSSSPVQPIPGQPRETRSPGDRLRTLMRRKGKARSGVRQERNAPW